MSTTACRPRVRCVTLRAVLSPRSSLLSAACALALAACRTKQPEPPPLSVVAWAGSERVAVVSGKEGVVAKAVDSGKTRVLHAGPVQRATLDTELELLWIQTQTSLKVVDLRDAKTDAILVADGLPAGVPLDVHREIGRDRHTSLPEPSGCMTSTLLTVTWSEASRMEQITDNGTAPPPGATLPGSEWLRAQLHRPRGSAKVVVEAISYLPPAAPLPLAADLHCQGDPFCGVSVPFGRTGRQLVVTKHEEGDCHHFTCRIYDPATKKAEPPGTCGPFRFDRSGERYLVEGRACMAQGACQDLGGEAIGWLSGGVTAGSSD